MIKNMCVLLSAFLLLLTTGCVGGPAVKQAIFDAQGVSLSTGLPLKEGETNEDACRKAWEGEASEEWIDKQCDPSFIPFTGW